MSVERRGDPYVYTWLDAGNIGHDSRKVSLQVKSQRQKVRDHQNPRGAACSYMCDRSRQIGLALLEKRRFDQMESALPGKQFGDSTHRVVRRSDTRPVRENDDPCFQALPAR